jgi:outer membrane autotransporter protein
VHNAGGLGAETVGNGIALVEVLNKSASANGVFALTGHVAAGAFVYDLFHNGVGVDAADGNWYLRSSFIVGPVVPGEPEVPIGPSPPLGTLPPGIFPIIGPELATFGVVQPIARELGLAMVGTQRERFGDSLEGSCGYVPTTSCCATPAGAVTTTAVVPDGGCRPAMWGRVIGQSIDNRYQAFADPQATGQLLGFQAGFDLWRGSLIAGHTDTAGVYFAYGNANVDVNGLVTNAAATGFEMIRTGTVSLNGYSGGAYWTHYGPSGWYVDAVIQGTGYDGSATTQFSNLPIHGSGFVTSLEAGYPFPLPWFGPRFVLEPQGQIIWQQVSFQGADNGLGPVDLGATSGATGRLGLRGKWTMVSANGTVWQPYVQANIWRDWGADATTTFGLQPVPLIEQATRLEFAGGVTARLGPRFSLFAQGGWQFASDERGPNPYRRDSVKGDIGVRYAW